MNEGLQSMLSQLPAVKISFLGTLGYTTLTSSEEANVQFATSVAICCTRSYDTDNSFYRVLINYSGLIVNQQPHV